MLTIITHAIEFVVYIAVCSFAYIIGFKVTPIVEKQNVVVSILGSLILYLITLAAMILALVCFLFFIHKDVDYSTFITSLVLWVISVLSVNIARDIILSKKKNKKEITARIIAPVVAMLTIAFFLLGPLF